MSMGFDACGFAAAVAVDDEAVARYDRWIDQGRNGCMQWAAGHRDLRRDPPCCWREPERSFRWP